MSGRLRNNGKAVAEVAGRRTQQSIVGIVLLGFAPLAWAQQDVGAHARLRPRRPNIVILLADDLGYRDIGCYGGPVRTPTLDRLAAEGVRFTNFYSGAAVCSPSRATLLTGRQHLRTGIYSWIHDHEQNSHLLLREVTLAEVLKGHGYQTVHLGKWHLGMPTRNRPKPTPSDHGFDYWFATANNAGPSHRDPINFVRNGRPVGKTEGYACQIVVDEAIAWLDERRDGDRPFFLNVWFHEPHAPLAAPPDLVARYGQPNDPAAIYSATIDNTDRAIARLLEKLSLVAAPENTLIVYSSDNGSYRADCVGDLRGTKGSNYDGGIRVPGIFHWPGTIPGGRIERDPAGLVDLLPTICGLLGVKTPKAVHLDGSDLSPLLVGGAERFVRHQPLFWLLPAAGPTVALRDGRYTLVATRDYELPRDIQAMDALRRKIESTLRRNGTYEDEIRGSTLAKQMFEGFKDREAEKLRGQFIRLNMFQESWIPTIKAGGYRRFELFDMAADPGQKKDVSQRHPDVVARLKQQLLALRASVMAEAPEWHANPDGGESKRPERPARRNVLFLAVDDLNDWVGCLGGHPQARTPNIDRLAAKGVLFEQAYCAAPLCNPSRTAIMTGLRPSTTGIYGNKAWLRDIPRYENWETIPQYFRKHGYVAATGGKIYHQANGKWSDPIAWDRQYSKKSGTPSPPPQRRLQHGMSGKFKNPYHNDWVDWVPLDQPEEATADWQTADLAAQFLRQKHDRPFFLGCGIFRPHLRWYVPKKYFDMHPLAGIRLPTRPPDDLEDVPPMGHRMAGEEFTIVEQHGQWKNAVQGYLAACSFADACVGHVLNALDRSEHRDNTIVVLWGDHGYHIGQKRHFAKSALWKEATRTPLIIHVPGVSKPGARCASPVSLVDLYPTLVDLCGLPGRRDLDGRSLAPLVRSPSVDWPYPVVITHSPFWYGANHAVRSLRYHYIRYRDGGEELYDNVADPHGWTNLANDPTHAEAKEELKKWLPKRNAEHFRDGTREH